VNKTRLGDICTIIKGTKVEQTEQDCNSIRYIQIEDLRSNECIKYCEKKEHYVIANPRDIIIAWDGANAGTVGFGLNGAIGSTLAIIRLNEDDFDTRFIGMLLRSKFTYLRSNCTGATIPHINRRSLEEIRIPIMPLEKQKQIVKTLDAVSELLSLRKQQLLKLDNLTKSIFYDMFGDLVTNEKGWNQIALGEVGTFKNGINYSRNKSGFSVRCLGVGDFKDLLYIKDVSHLPFIELPELPSQEYLLQNGDIVFVRSNGNKELIGRCIEIFPGEEHVTFSGFCIRYRITVDCLTSHYLNYALHVSSLKKKLLKDGRGCNIQNINQQTLSALSIPVPPIELQNEFTMIATKIEDQKNLVQKSIQETQLLFDSLMSQYFDE